MKKILLLLMLMPALASAQDDELDALLNEGRTDYIENAFKSTRVINGQSIEMLNKGVLDFRILHRFGLVKNGLKDLFGLDVASMRMGFDYGLSDRLGIGIGRSTFNKEMDGFVKYKVLRQSTGEKKMPISLIWVSGMTVRTLAYQNDDLNSFENKLGYFHQAIIGRKFSDGFSLQFSPTLVHRNLVQTATDNNTIYALGIGARLKMSDRTALILDTYPQFGANPSNTTSQKIILPLSIGVDIETGGHVFQLHFSNARGMNEKAFITETFNDWGQGQFAFGFNLSRVFTVQDTTK